MQLWLLLIKEMLLSASYFGHCGNSWKKSGLKVMQWSRGSLQDHIISWTQSEMHIFKDVVSELVNN